MQKAAQSSQLKNGNLGGGRVYAFRVSRINADFVSLKLWLLGGVIRARNIAVAALPDFIAQIDAALADGCEVVAPDGAEFSAPEKVLSGIRKEFSSYCCLGASDAKHALGGVATPTKPQASVRAVEPPRVKFPIANRLRRPNASAFRAAMFAATRKSPKSPPNQSVRRSATNSNPCSTHSTTSARCCPSCLRRAESTAPRNSRSVGGNVP